MPLDDAAILFAVGLGNDILGLDDGGLELLELGLLLRCVRLDLGLRAATSAVAFLTSASSASKAAVCVSIVP